MKQIACQEWCKRASDSQFVFLTGDLGFMLLEKLQKDLGDRFINAGISEQNMVSTAAGLALEGMNPWVYSIASFCVSRPFEQIRNDVCQHNLPVKLVGNGGGYGYGVMGASHHALEDYGILLTLPGLKVVVPAFAEDIPPIIQSLQDSDCPVYLRLGRCEKPPEVKPVQYSSWRRILAGEKIPIVVVGPIAGDFWAQSLNVAEEARSELWVLSELPVLQISDLPDILLEHAQLRGLCVVEEHTAQGSVGQQMAKLLLSSGIQIPYFMHFCAGGYPSGRYGSQFFHRHESGITASQVFSKINQVE